MNAFRFLLTWSQRHWLWLKWLVALAVLGFLFYLHGETLRQLTERRIEWGYFLAAFAVAAVSIGLTFVRWYLLVWAQDIPFKLRDAFRLGFLGYLFNYVAPGSVGGDFIKGIWIAREQPARRTVAIATIVFDRILGLVALFMVGALASLLPLPLLDRPEMKTIVAVLWGGTLAGTLGLLVMLHPATIRSRWWKRLVSRGRIGRIIAALVQAIALYQSRPRVVVAGVGISIVGHVGILSAFYLCALALHASATMPSYSEHLLFIPAAEVVGVVIPLPGGVGALEGAVMYFYGLANSAAARPIADDVAQANGLLTALGFRAISIVLAAIGGCYYFAARREIDAALEEAAARDES